MIPTPGLYIPTDKTLIGPPCSKVFLVVYVIVGISTSDFLTCCSSVFLGVKEKVFDV